MRALALGILLASSAAPQGTTPGGAIHTDRPGRQLLQLPKRDDAFGFVVFGDRTSGVPAGMQVLEQAIDDTNLLDPDFVMTVGDLIQGYNTDTAWHAQMREFKRYMARLRMPWFPVAGNHDIYFRGDDAPLRHHEANYEKHFGPLWYAFEHKQCWFIVLFSDEGDPETGAKAFDKPALQRMSPEQFSWLDRTLDQAKDARHVFVFLHHPRWLGRGYGDDWERVHDRLASANNVRAVFAGHIHQMRYDGERDGIEYFALATTGGKLAHEIPEAGYLHHFNVVTVRGDDISMATVPVGALLDPREVTGQISDDVTLLAEQMAVRIEGPALTAQGSANGLVRVEVANPSTRPIELTLTPGAGDAGWTFSPDHTHTVIAAGERTRLSFAAARTNDRWSTLRRPRIQIDCDYLGEGVRISLPPRVRTIEISAPPDLAAGLTGEPGTMSFDGDGDALKLPSGVTSIPDGPFTVESWLCGRDFAGRRGLFAKTQQAEYGIFVSDGRVRFGVHLDGAYRRVATAVGALKPGVWYHVAGVFDGSHLRLYVDGRLIGSEPASGVRTRNDLPFYVGADVGRFGQGTAWFDGEIDEFRLSSSARYLGEEFEPRRRFESDADTVVLLHMDQRLGPWAVDHSPNAAHAQCVGDVRAVEAVSGR